MAIVNPAGRWVGITALQLLAWVSISCAFGDSPHVESDHSEEGGTVNVVLKEWFILPDKMTVDEGRITFKVANHGHMDHEFIIIKTEIPVHDLPVHEKGLDEDKAGKAIGEIEDLRPGEVKELTLDMPRGKYVLFCNKVETEDHKIISHYRHGMRVAFTVK
jgi:uncharacterized cupredoxin-like copper-binding protein